MTHRMKLLHQAAIVVSCHLLLLPAPVVGVLFRQTLSSYPDAVCTDGTPAAYYHTWTESPAELALFKNYVIYLDGGGYCPSVKDCHLRCAIANNLCTEPKVFMKDHHGILSDEAFNNPHLHDYYKVELPYCTGDMYIGRRLASEDTDGLNFAGRIVFDAMIQSLRERTLIGLADNVVLSGSSAGGAGVAFNCEHLQELLPGVRVWCVVDAAFFYPISHPLNNATTCESIDRVLQMGSHLWGAPEVSKFHLQSWWNDMKPSTKIFLGVAKYDIFGFESFCGEFENAKDLKVWGKKVWPLMKRLLSQQPDIGLFSAGCRYHMILHSDALFNRLRAGPKRLTYAQALANWMDGKPASTYQIWDSCPKLNFCNQDCDANGLPDPKFIETS